jgi:hypothetical protein
MTFHELLDTPGQGNKDARLDRRLTISKPASIRC